MSDDKTNIILKAVLGVFCFFVVIALTISIYSLLTNGGKGEKGSKGDPGICPLNCNALTSAQSNILSKLSLGTNGELNVSAKTNFNMGTSGISGTTNSPLTTDQTNVLSKLSLGTNGELNVNAKTNFNMGTSGISGGTLTTDQANIIGSFNLVNGVIEPNKPMNIRNGINILADVGKQFKLYSKLHNGNFGPSLQCSKTGCGISGRFYVTNPRAELFTSNLRAFHILESETILGSIPTGGATVTWKNPSFLGKSATPISTYQENYYPSNAAEMNLENP